jgi:hypothetical protein
MWPETGAKNAAAASGMANSIHAWLHNLASKTCNMNNISRLRMSDSHETLSSSATPQSFQIRPE